MIEDRETTYAHIGGSKIIEVYAGEQWSIHNVLDLKEKCPSLCEIKTVNPDGSVLAHIDFSLMPKFHKPRSRNLTDEQRQILVERMAKAREVKNSNK